MSNDLSDLLDKIPTHLIGGQKFDPLGDIKQVLTPRERKILKKLKQQQAGRQSLRLWATDQDRADLELIAKTWGQQSLSAAGILAIRYLAKLTREGLEEVKL